MFELTLCFVCKCVQWRSPLHVFRVKNQLCKSIFSHHPYGIGCSACRLLYGRMFKCNHSSEETPKGFVMDLYGKIKPILWRGKPAAALVKQASQGAFSVFNANASTFPCCSVGKSCYPTSHPVHQLRNPQRQAMGCNPAAGLKLRY